MKTYKFLLGMLSLVILLRPVLKAQNLSELSPKYKKIQKYMDKAVKKGLVGMAFYIDHPKYGQWTATSGLANKEINSLVTENSVFYTGSISKIFTATATLYLYEQRKLDIEDKIAKYLPDEIIQNMENAEQVTIKQLLNMTSGFPNFEYNERLIEDYFEGKIDIQKILPLEMLRKYQFGQSARFPPGEKFEYSSTNYILLALILDEIYGRSHLELFKEIFRKAGLTNIGYKKAEKLTDQLVEAYADMDNDGILENVTTHQKNYAQWSIGEDGVMASAKDLGLFMKKLTQGEIISKDSFSKMQDWVTPPDPVYGLGLMYDKGFPYKSYIGHAGWGFGTKANVYYFPKQKITIAVLCNTGYRFGGKKLQKAYEKFIKKTSIKLFFF